MAETIHVRGEGGAVIAMDLPLPEAIQERLTKGLLRRVNADGTPYEELASVQPPAKTASKAEWVGWAVSLGAAVEDAEGMTKTDLVEKYGGTDASDQ